MKKIIVYICAAALLTAAGGKQAHAIGLAVSRQVSVTSMPVPRVFYSSVVNSLVNRILGVGVILDTAVARDRLFNYRISLDCHSVISQKELGYTNVSFSTNRLTVANSFGFGFIRTSFVRVWAGPQFALTYEFKSRNRNTFDTTLYSKIGPVLWINIHAGNETTFALEMGFRTGFGFDLGKSPEHCLFQSGLEPLVSFRLIFRPWDS